MPTPQRVLLEAVGSHRAELRESMSVLEQALAAPAGGRLGAWNEHLRGVVVDLSADLGEHIVVTEGPDGLYGGLLTTAPRLSNAVARLTREHAQIRDLAADLLSQLGPQANDADGARVVGSALLARLVRHRQRGLRLVHEAYQADIGGES